ncbi:10477_t:CDS:2, partial [Rhizophagus irregularis]
MALDVTNSLTEVSYHETESNLQVLEGDSFSDNSLILRLVKPSQLDNCYEPKLYLRLVKSDGTVQPLDLGDDIPQNNFCKIDPLTGTSFHKNKHHNHCRKRWDNCPNGGNNNGGNGGPNGGNNNGGNGGPNGGNNNGGNGGPNGGNNNGGNGGPNGGNNNG